MRRLVITSAAERDLFEVWMWMARESISAADRQVDRFTETFDLLCQHSELGQAVALRESQQRFFTVGAYVVFYRPVSDDELVIDRVIHGSRVTSEMVEGKRPK
jgi:toxin ParE1/3/4